MFRVEAVCFCPVLMRLQRRLCALSVRPGRQVSLCTADAGCRLLPCRANLTAAGDSDARLEARLASSGPAFAALSVDAAAVQMPRLQVRAQPCTPDLKPLLYPLQSSYPLLSLPA